MSHAQSTSCAEVECTTAPEHIWEVFRFNLAGMFGCIWQIRCVRCKKEITAMTAGELILNTAPPPPPPAEFENGKP